MADLALVRQVAIRLSKVPIKITVNLFSSYREPVHKPLQTTRYHQPTLRPETAV